MSSLSSSHPTKSCVLNMGLKQRCPSASPFYCILDSYLMEFLHSLEIATRPRLVPVTPGCPLAKLPGEPTQQYSLPPHRSYVDDFAWMVSADTP
eukprot:9641981-Prorocentrum_lima.AAC.1